MRPDALFIVGQQCPHDGTACSHACPEHGPCLRQELGCKSSPEEGFPVFGTTPVREEPEVEDGNDNIGEGSEGVAPPTRH